jgi:hypothetical protein
VIAHARSGEHYARCERQRLPGESLLDSIRRHAVEDAVTDCGSETHAAKLLGCSQQYVSALIGRSIELRVDASLGNPPRKRGPRPGMSQWSPERRAAHNTKRDAKLARLAQIRRFGI